MSETDEIFNRPGQSALAYRITDQAGSSSRMLARLHTFAIPDGPNQGKQPLAQLTTRAAADPTIALIDACAAVVDVLSFYQERLANEAYLRTATENLSLVQLVRTVGYQPAPAIAASTYLAFTVDTAKGMPDRVTVAAGSQILSVPGPGETMQTFETSSDLLARATFNQLQPLLSQTQSLLASDDPTSGALASTIRLAGVANRVSVGDLLRIASGVTVRVAAVNPVNAGRYTDLTVTPLSAPALRLASPAALPQGNPQTLPATLNASTVSQYILGCTWDDASLSACLAQRGWSESDLRAQVQVAQQGVTAPQVVLTYRQVAGSFGASAPSFASLPKPNTTYYRGDDLYSSSNSSWDEVPSGNNLRTIWVDSWGNRYADGTPGYHVYLERVIPGILPGSSVLLSCPRAQSERTVTAITTTTLRGYATTARVTGLKLNVTPADQTTAQSDTFLTRDTMLYVQSANLPLTATVPLTDCSVTTQVTLNTIVLGLVAGQPLIVTGEAFDSPGVTLTEVAFLSQAVHSGGYTTLYFQSPLSRGYRLSTLSLTANVVAATHGETVASELLGSGDGSQVNQSFVLKRKPLTYLPATDASGAASTMEVRVNGVLWREVPSLLAQDPHSPCYIITRDESGVTTVRFGDGVHGARLPSGQNNIVARYRVGSGPSGQVRSATLRQFINRPIGLRAVQNPMAAVGGVASETLDSMRTSAPVSSSTLGRAVSILDYEALAAIYAGIGKAQGQGIALGGTPTVLLTVAADDGTPLPPSSPLYQDLCESLLALGNPTQALLVCDYQPVSFRVHAALTIDPSYVAADVIAAVSAALSTEFSFSNRSLGQPVRSAEVLYAIQSVPGVIGVILTQLYRASAPAAASSLLTAAPASIDASGVGHGAELLLLNLIPSDLEISS